MMKKKCVSLYTFLFLLFFVSCNEATSYSDSLECFDVDSLKSQIVNDRFMFASPKTIFLCDSVLVVSDTRCGDNLFHVFDKKQGGWIVSGGNKGEGPGEVIAPSKPHVDSNGIISYWDANSLKLLKYDINKIIAGNEKDRCFDEIILKDGLALHTLFLDVIPTKDSYIYNGNNEKHIGIGNSRNYLTCNSLPAIQSEEEVWSILNHSRLALSPDQKHLVQATSIGGIVKGYELVNGVKECFSKLYFAPEYQLAQGVSPVWIKWCDESRMGFDNVCVSDNNIYLLLNGKIAKDKPFANEILMLDWNGNILKKYVVDKTVNSIAVDEDNHIIYAMTAGFGVESAIVKFDY